MLPRRRRWASCSKTARALVASLALLAGLLTGLAVACKSESPERSARGTGDDTGEAALRRGRHGSIPPAPGAAIHRLTPLAPAPDWSELDRYQRTMSRDEFVRLLDQVYTQGGDYRSFIDVFADHATVKTSSIDPARTYTIHFAPAGRTAPVGPRQPAGHVKPDASRPLAGLTIAIDPGHIGGQWAAIESRWFRIGDSAPVAEGDLTLQVARLLAAELGQRGARVTLVRDAPRPLTRADPRQFEPMARKLLALRGVIHGGLSRAREAHLIEQESLRLTYRSAEIRARAQLINERIKPDFTICIHFDAASWDRPGRPSLTDRNHLHAIVHGSYTAAELAFEDMRFGLLQKLLRRDHDTELAMTRRVVHAMARTMELLPEDSPESAAARRMSEDGYIWARNLLANRLYRGPVIYLEPYVMNNRGVFARIQAGDYAGLRHIAGKRRPSIYREYASAVTRGLMDYFQYGDAGAPASDVGSMGTAAPPYVAPP